MDRYSAIQHPRDDPNETYYSDYEEKIPEFRRNDHRDGEEEEDGESPVVEITLQCLGGIQCRQRAAVTAQVSFSGSAKDMQVGSSMLCGRTGQLVVESQSSLLDEEEQGTVYWTQSPKQKPGAQPHLTIRLPPNQDPRVPNISLSKVNRNSRLVVKKDYETDDDEHDLNAVPSLQDESEDSGSTHSQDVLEPVKATGVNAPDDGTVRGGSIIWSASGAGMPEIVELHVTLLAEDEVDEESDEDDDDMTSAASGVLSSPQQQGIAHLVFYGNDYGTFVLDLPVKKVYSPSSTNPASPPPSPVSGMVWMNTDAYIRVQVSVLAPGRQRRRQEELQSMMMRSTGSWVNNNHEDRWTTIIRQLQENEEQARRLRLQQLNPQYSLDELNVTQNEQEEKAQIIWEDGDEGLPRLFKSRGPSSRLFCPTVDTNLGGGGDGVGVGAGGGAARWMDAVVESFSRVASCQYPKRNPFPTMIVSRHRKATTTTNSKTRRKAVDTSSDDYEWSIAETDTMVSTIATRDSLNI